MRGIGFQEAFHVAHDMVLTDKEKALLDTHIGDEEAQADHYAAWVEARKKGRGTAWGKLWQKIQDFARKMQAILTRTENVHNVLRKIESGDVWSRTAEDLQQENKKFAVTNAKITGKTRVPIIDVTGQPMVDVNDQKVKSHIASILMGRTFRIIGSGGIGRVATMDDGRHVVGSSSNPTRTHPTRKRAMSLVEDVLNNAVYVEKHPDVDHGTDTSYIELFAAIKDGKKIFRFRILAKEGVKSSGRYVVREARFYDIIKEKNLPTHASKDAHIVASFPNRSLSADTQQNKFFNTISVAELLQGVNDRINDKPYVNPDGSLNYNAKLMGKKKKRKKILSSTERRRGRRIAKRRCTSAGHC